MNRLKELREEKGLYQNDVADYLEMDQSNYSKYELGKISIPVAVLSKLADFYGTSVDYIICRTDAKEPHEKSASYKG